VSAARVNAFQRQSPDGSVEAFSCRHANAFSAGRWRGRLHRFTCSQPQQQQQQQRQQRQHQLRLCSRQSLFADRTDTWSARISGSDRRGREVIMDVLARSAVCLALIVVVVLADDAEMRMRPKPG